MLYNLTKKTTLTNRPPQLRPLFKSPRIVYLQSNTKMTHKWLEELLLDNVTPHKYYLSSLGTFRQAFTNNVNEFSLTYWSLLSIVQKQVLIVQKHILLFWVLLLCPYILWVNLHDIVLEEMIDVKVFLQWRTEMLTISLNSSRINKTTTFDIDLLFWNCYR